MGGATRFAKVSTLQGCLKLLEEWLNLYAFQYGLYMAEFHISLDSVTQGYRVSARFTK